MGLSNSERRVKMAFAIRNVVHAARHLPDEHKSHDLRPTKDLVDKLWYAFLAKESNSTHWIFGSSADNEIDGRASSLWDIALSAHFDEQREDNWLEKSKEDRANAYWKLSYDEQLRTLDPFFEDKQEEEASIPNLLAALDKRMSLDPLKHTVLDKVYLIYAHTESLQYALRRYDDDFRKGFADLDVLMSRLQGACFTIFSQDTSYAFAYLLNQILDRHFLRPFDAPQRLLAIKLGWPSKIAHRLAETHGEHLTLDRLMFRHKQLVMGQVKSLTHYIELAYDLMQGTSPTDPKDILKIAAANGWEVDEDLIQRAYKAADKVYKALPKPDYVGDKADAHIAAIHGWHVFSPHKPKRAKKRKAKTPEPAKVKGPDTPKSPKAELLTALDALGVPVSNPGKASVAALRRKLQAAQAKATTPLRLKDNE